MYTNALLTISLRDESRENYGDISQEEPMETDGETMNLYNS